MKRRLIFIGWMVVAILLLSSCASRKRFVYLQDMWPGMIYPSETKHEAVIHRDDRLAITVGSKNPELAIPFNMQEVPFGCQPTAAFPLRMALPRETVKKVIA